MEWIEISGRAKMTSLIMPSVLSTKPETLDLMPFCLACVDIEDGSQCSGTRCNKEKQSRIIKKECRYLSKQRLFKEKVIRQLYLP